MFVIEYGSKSEILASRTEHTLPIANYTFCVLNFNVVALSTLDEFDLSLAIVNVLHKKVSMPHTDTMST